MGYKSYQNRIRNFVKACISL